jgi:hypothetical protein
VQNNEFTAILDSGRFKTLLEHLFTRFASLRADARQHHRLSRPASALDKYTRHEQYHSVDDEQESLQSDELVAEIEQRMAQLENFLTRYSSRYNHTPTKRVHEPSIFRCRSSTLCAHTVGCVQIYDRLPTDGDGGGSHVTALSATRSAQNYAQVLITVALILTSTAPYSHNLLPPCSQYLVVLKPGMMSSWRKAELVGYAEKVRAAAYR